MSPKNLIYIFDMLIYDPFRMRFQITWTTNTIPNERPAMRHQIRNGIICLINDRTQSAQQCWLTLNLSRWYGMIFSSLRVPNKIYSIYSFFFFFGLDKERRFIKLISFFSRVIMILGISVYFAYSNITKGILRIVGIFSKLMPNHF